MLISELLNLFYMLKLSISTMSDRDGLTAIQMLESEYTFERLKAFISSDYLQKHIAEDPYSPLNASEIEWLAKFLETRWDYIQETNSCYSRNSAMPVNIICIDIAQKIANTCNKKRAELLMPTLKGTRNSHHLNPDNNALDFIPALLSDTLGINLFCSNIANLKYLFQLNSEEKSFCLKVLSSSNNGQLYLNSMKNVMNLLEQKNQSDVQEIIHSQSSVSGIKTIATNNSHVSENLVIFDNDDFQEKQTPPQPLSPPKKRSGVDRPFFEMPREKKQKPANLEHNSNSHYEQESDIQQQFEIPVSEYHLDDESTSLAEEIHLEHTDNIITIESDNESDTPREHNDKEIATIYRNAKRELQKINKTFKQEEIAADLLYNRTNTPSLAAEKKAAHTIKKRVIPLLDKLNNHYKNSTSFEDQLESVKISIEFIHEYPVKKSIFTAEINAMQRCLSTCNKVINSFDNDSLAYKQEAFDYKGIITTKHIPIITYNYAVLHHKAMEIKSMEITENHSDDLNKINAFIKSLNSDIKNLKKALKLYEELKTDFCISPIINTIKTYIAKSHEDIGDYQYKLLDIECTDNPNSDRAIKLLNNIKYHYQKSFKYFNNEIVCLAIATCQYKLIEIYIYRYQTDNALSEINTLIQELDENMSPSLTTSATEDETSCKLERISTMLYACNKGFSLTKSEEYRKMADTYLKSMIPFLTSYKKCPDLESLTSEIHKYARELDLIQSESSTFLLKSISPQPATPRLHRASFFSSNDQTRHTTNDNSNCVSSKSI